MNGIIYFDIHDIFERDWNLSLLSFLKIKLE